MKFNPKDRVISKYDHSKIGTVICVEKHFTYLMGNYLKIKWDKDGSEESINENSLLLETEFADVFLGSKIKAKSVESQIKYDIKNVIQAIKKLSNDIFDNNVDLCDQIYFDRSTHNEFVINLSDEIQDLNSSLKYIQRLLKGDK